MLETELFALLEQTADAAYTVTEGGEICSWNRAAERLFGYSASEVLHRNIDEVLEARDTLGTNAPPGGSGAATPRWDGTSRGVPNFSFEVRTPNPPQRPGAHSVARPKPLLEPTG